MTHALKTWPEYFQAVCERGKSFEVRKADRPFKVGETILLQEWDNVNNKYTGDEVEREITYILEGGQFGIEPGFVVMGIKEIIDNNY
jgi:Domain of unknown function (DUF3850)